MSIAERLSHLYKREEKTIVNYSNGCFPFLLGFRQKKCGCTKIRLRILYTILFIKADFAGVCKTLATTGFLQIFRTGKPLPLGLG